MKQNPGMLSEAAGDRIDLQSVAHSGGCDALSSSFSWFDICFKKCFLESFKLTPQSASGSCEQR